MLAALLALTLAAPTAAAADDRHAATRLIEAHRALQAEQLQARTTASELYHYATHRLDLEPEVVRTMTADLTRAVDAGGGRLEAMRQGLTAAQRTEVATELQLLADWQGKAAAAVGSLKNEVAKDQPDGRELRFHTSAVYGALAAAGEAHGQLMQQLRVKLVEGTVTRAR